MFTPSLTHVSPLWLNFSFLFTLCIPQMYDISFENCLFHLIIVSVFTQSWHTCTTSTNIIDQNKEIKKKPIFVFNLFYIACIEWTDYCTTGNGGKSTSHVVPALIRVCGLSGGSRGGARGAQPPLIFRPKWGPKGRKKFIWSRGPPLISGSGWRPPLSVGLDPPMGFSVSLSVWFHVVLFPFCPSENISTTSTSDDQRSKWIRFIQVFAYFYLCVYLNP